MDRQENLRSYDRVFCSYSLKTMMLWKCEGISSAQFWEEQNLASSIEFLILYFVELLIDRICPNYFIRNCNIYAHVDSSLSFDREIQYLAALVENHTVETYLVTYSIVRESEFCLTDLNLQFHERFYNLCGMLSILNFAGLNQILLFQRFARSSNDLRTLCKGLHLQRKYFVTPKSKLEAINEKILECFQTPEYKLDYQSDENLLQVITSMMHLSIPEIFRVLCEYYKSDDFVLPFKCEDSFVTSRARPFQSMLLKSSLAAFKSFKSCFTDPERWFNIFLDIALSTNPPICHFITTAYRANYLYVCAKDYRRATTVCEDALTRIYQLIYRRMEEDFYVVLSNQWIEIYDKRIQAIFGFIILWNTRFYRHKRKVGKDCNTISLQMNPEVFLKYIKLSILYDEQIEHSNVLPEDSWPIHVSELWRYLFDRICDNRGCPDPVIFNNLLQFSDQTN